MSNSVVGSAEDLEFICSPAAIRSRAAAIFDLAKKGKTHFQLHEDKLDEVAEFVAKVTLENYPDLNIPFHSRWGHFQASTVDRMSVFREKISHLSAEEQLRAKIDLVIVSVLLDAGSGPGWKYAESETGKTIARSEGLAVASFHMFMNGDFSSDPKTPFRVDAQGLANLKAEQVAAGFQVSASNPLAGFDGRFQLLKSLGKAVQNNKEIFPGTVARPGNMYDHFAKVGTKKIAAPALLRAVQKGLGEIWPGRISMNGTNLGDVWSYAPLGNGINSLVPFHKLSQWLTYSLIEPFLDGGFEIDKVTELTGLAEYRNGGLILDGGLVSLRDASDAQKVHKPDSELIVEWRALTLVFLEKLAERVRTRLGKSEQEFPLGKVLEGGTWWAGRKLAAMKRTGGTPPLELASDGTVF